jgi:hypothetical protein
LSPFPPLFGLEKQGLTLIIILDYSHQLIKLDYPFIKSSSVLSLSFFPLKYIELSPFFFCPAATVEAQAHILTKRVDDLLTK